MAKKNANKDGKILMFAIVFAVLGVVSLAMSSAARNNNSNKGSSNTAYSWTVNPNPGKYDSQVTLTVNADSTPSARIMKLSCDKDDKTVQESYHVFSSSEITSSTSNSFSHVFPVGNTALWQSGGASCTGALGALNSKAVFQAVTSTSFSVNP